MQGQNYLILMRQKNYYISINFLIPVEPIPIPAPSNNPFENAVDAIPITKSPNSMSPSCTENEVPSTNKSFDSSSIVIDTNACRINENFSRPVIVSAVILIPIRLHQLKLRRFNTCTVYIITKCILIPVNAEPSPLNDVHYFEVTIPEATTVSNTA